MESYSRAPAFDMNEQKQIGPSESELLAGSWNSAENQMTRLFAGSLFHDAGPAIYLLNYLLSYSLTHLLYYYGQYWWRTVWVKK